MRRNLLGVVGFLTTVTCVVLAMAEAGGRASKTQNASGDERETEQAFAASAAVALTSDESSSVSDSTAQVPVPKASRAPYVRPPFSAFVLTGYIEAAVTTVRTVANRRLSAFEFESLPFYHPNDIAAIMEAINQVGEEMGFAATYTTGRMIQMRYNE